MTARTNALLVLALLASSTAEAQRAATGSGTRVRSIARAIGMVADGSSESAVVFDANTDSVLGAVQLGDGAPVCFGDCVITSDLTRGYVATQFAEIWIVDLTTTPPSLASGTNPILINNNGLDLALSPDDRFLVSCGGNANQQLEVVDLTTLTLVGTFTSSSWVTAEVGPDNSVVIASEGGDRVRRLVLDATGNLTNPGEVMRETMPLNISIVPDGSIGLLVTYPLLNLMGQIVSPGRVRSFTIHGMLPIQTFTPPGTDFIVNAIADPGASRAYVRRELTLLALPFDAATGFFGGTPIWSVALGDIIPCYGNEQLVLHPNRSKLYTTIPTGVQVVDAATGALITTITHPDLPLPTGMDVRGVEAVVEAAMDAKAGACPNSFNLESHGVLPVALIGTDAFDASEVDVTTLRLARADGTGGSVLALRGPPGPRAEIVDVTEPVDGAICDCHKVAGDGKLDFESQFDSDALVDALELEATPPGTQVELVLTGELLDGTGFSASDCVRVVSPNVAGCKIRVVSTVSRGWVQVSPLDLLLDGGGFGEFERTYPQGTNVTLVAEEIPGSRFVAWEVDGVQQKLGARTLLYRAKAAHAVLRAVYGGPRVKR